MTPLSGPLARFGRAGAAALDLWAREAPATFEVVDAHPDPAAAMVAAVAGRPDVLFGPYGSSPAVTAIAAVAGKTARPCGTTAGPLPVWPGRSSHGW